MDNNTLLLRWSPLTAIGYMTNLPPWSSLGAQIAMLSGSCSAPKLCPSSWVVTRSASWIDNISLCFLMKTSSKHNPSGNVKAMHANLSQNSFSIIHGACQASVQVTGFLDGRGWIVCCKTKWTCKVKHCWIEFHWSQL